MICTILLSNKEKIFDLSPWISFKCWESNNDMKKGKREAYILELLQSQSFQSIFGWNRQGFSIAVFLLCFVLFFRRLENKKQSFSNLNKLIRNPRGIQMILFSGDKESFSLIFLFCNRQTWSYREWFVNHTLGANLQWRCELNIRFYDVTGVGVILLAKIPKNFFKWLKRMCCLSLNPDIRGIVC